MKIIDSASKFVQAAWTRMDANAGYREDYIKKLDIAIAQEKADSLRKEGAHLPDNKWVNWVYVGFDMLADLLALPGEVIKKYPALTTVVFAFGLASCMDNASNGVSPNIVDTDGNGLDDRLESALPMGTGTPEANVDSDLTVNVETYLSKEMGVAAIHARNQDGTLYAFTLRNNAELDIDKGTDGVITAELHGNDFSKTSLYTPYAENGSEGYVASEMIGGVELGQWVDKITPNTETEKQNLQALNTILQENPELVAHVVMTTDYNRDASGERLVNMGLSTTISVGGESFVFESTLEPIEKGEVFADNRVASVDASFGSSTGSEDVVFKIVPDDWKEIEEGVFVSPEFVKLQGTINKGDRFTLNSDGNIVDNGKVVKGVVVEADGDMTITVDGEKVVLDPDTVSFDDKNGMQVEGYELVDGAWVEAAVMPDIEMTPLPDNAKDIKVTVATEGMTVAGILEQAKPLFGKWEGKLLATEIMIARFPNEGNYETMHINMNGDAAKAIDVPVKNLGFILRQDGLNEDGEKIRPFFPGDTLPTLAEKWNVSIDDIMIFPSVIYTTHGPIYFAGFTDAGFMTGADGRSNTYESKFLTCVGPDRTDTAMPEFDFGSSKADPFRATLPLIVADELVTYKDLNGVEKTAKYEKVWDDMAKLINLPLGESETGEERLAKMQHYFDQILVPVGCVKNISFNAEK